MFKLNLTGQTHFDNPDYFHCVFTNVIDLIYRGNPDIVNEWVYWLQDYPMQPDWRFRMHPLYIICKLEVLYIYIHLYSPYR